ncbi:MAG: glutamine synthetase family protein [Candidatus Thorarchaeota archaeon]|jgi:glutamine synthetase
MSEQIEYVELRFVDILGRMKAMIVPCNPADTLDELRKDPVLVEGTSLDGSSVAGLATVETSDLRLVPDLDSLIELPYSIQRTAAVMCSVSEKEGKEGRESIYPLDSRGALHTACERLLPGKMLLKAKIEPEFHFITQDGELFDFGGYADTYPQNPGADILLEIATAIRGMGMKPRVIHHEVGDSQQEIEISPADIRQMADFILTFKNLARTVAASRDIEVSFMPKPFEGAAGNGLHCHLQLWDGDENLFGKENDGHLSDVGRNFIAGLLEHAPALTAIANPTINSYKRLVPHHEAPVYITWGFRNRTVLVRVPLFKDKQKAAAELRSPDATANPYLLFSAIVAAGMDGVNRELNPPDPRSEDIFHLTDSERESFGIKMLPSSLREALNHLERDEVIRDAIGSKLIDAFIRVKRDEWTEYVNYTITSWEWSKYHSF